jgi:hypothetical protein
MLEKSVNVCENFLEEEYFQQLYELVINSGNINWFLNNYILDKNDKTDDFQFVHTLYSHKMGGQPNSPFFDAFIPLFEKINLLTLIRAKINLSSKTEKNVIGGFHNDFNSDKITTAVFYFNTNNGFTIFEDNTKILSKANTFVSFPAKLSHSGSTCTDKNYRVVLNINYLSETK